MYIVLTENVPNLGQKDEVVDVKAGYARNFLLPKEMAVICTKPMLKGLKEKAIIRAKKQEEIEANAKQIAQKLKELKLEIEKKVTKKGTLYGGVKAKDIIKLVFDATEIKLVEENLRLPEEMNKIGEYRIKANLTENTQAVFKLVIKEEK